MIINRSYQRKPPERDAKKIYIFCEGKTREYYYFNFFHEFDSRIDLQVYHLSDGENNSPEGLLNIAKKQLECCSFEEIDEVWIVFDTDSDKHGSREPQINYLRTFCSEKEQWNHAESNPCFELWLYYHFFSKKPSFEGYETSGVWKNKLNDLRPGGFDSRKHSIMIADAIENTKSNYTSKDNNRPDVGSTEVFKLAESIYKILEKNIDRRRQDSPL